MTHSPCTRCVWGSIGPSGARQVDLRQCIWQPGIGHNENPEASWSLMLGGSGGSALLGVPFFSGVCSGSTGFQMKRSSAVSSFLALKPTGIGLAKNHQMSAC